MVRHQLQGNECKNAVDVLHKPDKYLRLEFCSSTEVMQVLLVGAFELLQCLFLVGAFQVKRARLLQWLVFFFFFVRPQTSSCKYDCLVQTLLGLR